MLGEMIQNPEFGKEGLARLHGALENVEAITGELRAGRGFLGRVLSDQEFAGKVDDLSRTLGALAAFVEKLERGEGALGPLLEEDGAAEQAIESLRAASASLAQIAGRLEKPDGFLGRLLNDAEYSNALADDLGATLHNLSEITRKIDQGEGTLGALVNERTLHDGLEDVAAGTNDSKFARWLMRHYQKKGIKLSTEQMEKLSEE
jgi:phospholipid/cholesterol/gamma-HCH transport system substrate-binding protein